MLPSLLFAFAVFMQDGGPVGPLPDATPVPTPTLIQEAQAAPATVSLTMGEQVPFSQDVDMSVKSTAWIEGEAPLGLSGSILGRVYGRAGLNSDPSKGTPDLTTAENFQSGEFAAGFERVVGAVATSAGQTVTTSLIGEWGWSTRLSSPGRMSRHYGAGVKVASGNSYAVIMYGRDEATGDFGWGQIITFGSIDVPYMAGIVALTWDASLRAGPVIADTPGVDRRDVMRLGLATNAAKVLSVVGKVIGK